jgi:hypothetical protein
MMADLGLPVGWKVSMLDDEGNVVMNRGFNGGNSGMECSKERGRRMGFNGSRIRMQVPKKREEDGIQQR